MSERDPQGRDPRDRDPFDNLKDLIDQPVEPRDTFAGDLRSRLMREMSASEYSREEQAAPMDAVIAPRPPVAFPTESVRRIRPMVILELAAAALIVLGLVAALNRGWFQNDPESPSMVPAAALQDDSRGTPETEPQPTSTPLPTMVPDQDADMTLEPTVVPPGNLPNTIWALPGDGEIVNFGGLLVEDDTIYRLIATDNFVGIQAIDGRTGVAKWQQAQQWAGNFFAIEDDTLYFGGGDATLIAVDAETGERRRTMNVPGNPIAMAGDDSRIFVLLDSDMVVALDEQTGAQLWVAQGSTPQNPSGGSASIPAIDKIAVEDGVVAAISTYGVLSGFDVETGEELWSHDGYDAATVSIQTEDGQFVVTAGIGFATSDESESAMAASSTSNGTPPAVEGSSSATVSIATGDCFDTADAATESESASASPIPEMGASTSGVVSSISGVQTIDPKTGDIIAAQQSSAGGATVSMVTGDDGVVACVNPAEAGQAAGGSSQSAVAIGNTSDESVATTQGFDAFGQQAIAAVVEDGVAYVQLADGSLVKVSIDQTTPDDDHQPAQDDATPTNDD